MLQRQGQDCEAKGTCHPVCSPSVFLDKGIDFVAHILCILLQEGQSGKTNMTEIRSVTGIVFRQPPVTQREGGREAAVFYVEGWMLKAHCITFRGIY